MQGCNLNCPWCHNPETKPFKGVNLFYENLCVRCGDCDAGCVYGSRIVSGFEMSVDNIFEHIYEDLPYYEKTGGGVTISGGEPLLQADFCAKLAEKCRENKISVIIDTAGDVDFIEFEKLLSYTTCFYFDIKTSMKNYSMLGGNGERVYDNLKRLSKHVDIIVRYPVIPGFNDDFSTVDDVSDFLIESGIDEIHLLPFHRFGSGKYKALGLKYEYAETEAGVNIDRLTKVLSDKKIKFDVM